MSTSFHRGQFVQVTCGGKTLKAMVLLASENGRSLMLGFDGGLPSRSGGMFMGSLPVLMDDAGVYRDLIEDGEVTITAL